MIDISQLTEADKGKVVKYSTAATATKAEYGKITSWNTEYIFVDYYGHGRGTATRPIHLHFTDEVELKHDRQKGIWIVEKTLNLDEIK